MKIERLDHLVLTVTDIDATLAFYTEVLGMTAESFGKDRKTLKFGNQKINLHQKGKEIDPKAYLPVPGSADLCFITQTPISEVETELLNKGIKLIESKVERTGAMGRIISIYFRDPDLNLIEVSNYL
ncbi:MAG: hypothetical protein JWQ57_5259 [Mucilaginibacter sp.]|nr:hypothetical protein [Mucilaginibacter sp.]